MRVLRIRVSDYGGRGSTSGREVLMVRSYDARGNLDIGHTASFAGKDI